MKRQKVSKQPICKVCKKEFDKFKSTQKVCSHTCAIALVKQDNAKKLDKDIKIKEKLDRADIRKRKEALKTKTDHANDTQKTCNAYIRYKDGNKCISCETENPNIQYCAGHYKSRGARPELRFHPFNINVQCNHQCNMQLSGNIENYRPALIKKIGIDNVEWLEGPQEPQNWTIEDLKEIKQYYKDQLKILKESRGD